MKENNSLENSNLQSNQNSFDVHNFTFKIIKKRAPWTKEEDVTLFELVEKHGTTNWSIISTDLNLKYHLNNRTGKQCRERWHNHLAPNVNKDNWSDEEENILFTKHMEYGNKWSDIAQYLPGRTDNSIKNHFYSKLRKFIRKILKQINKENSFKNNGIDSNKYNGDKIYKLLKKYKITYKNLTKNTILEMILANEKNPKGKFSFSNNKIENNFNKDKRNLLLEEENKKEYTSNIDTTSNNLNFNSGNYTKSNINILNNEKRINSELFERGIIININNEINNIKYLNSLNKNGKNENMEKNNKNKKKRRLLDKNKNMAKNNRLIGKKRKRNKMRLTSFPKKTENSKNSLTLINKNNSSTTNIKNDNTDLKKINKTNISQIENSIEKIRDGIEIHPNRGIITINKKLLTEDLFQNNGHQFISKEKINIPTSPRIYQISSPSLLNEAISNKGMFNINFNQIYNDNKNYQVNNFFEQSQISPISFDNNLNRIPSNVNNFYNVDLGNEINILKNRNYFMNSNNNDNSFSNLNYGLYNFMTPNFNNEIHLFNKICIPNNIDNQINNDISLMQNMNNPMFNNPFNNNKNEMPTINLNLINQTGLSNSFCGNESLSFASNNNVSNLFNLSNYSPINMFISKNFEMNKFNNNY